MTSESLDAPQSASQARLWYFSRANPDDPSYNIGVAFDLHGPVSGQLLRAGLREIVRRHAVLRSTFDDRDGRPVQRVHPVTEPDLDVHDLSGPEVGADRMDRADGLERELVGRPFALTDRPPFRARLIELGLMHQRLVVCVHHIAFDARSIDVLVDELSLLYRAFARGAPAPLDELSLQYHHVADAEAERGDDPVGLAYWRDRLADHRRSPHLDQCDPTSADTGGPAGSVELALSRSVTDALRRRVHRRGTLFTALLAGFFLALHRQTGVADRVVGIAVSGRSRTEHDGLIGPFLNTVPVRVELVAGTGPDAVLDVVTAYAVEAIEHSGTPLQRIVQDADAGWPRDRRPLIDCLFVMQSGPKSELVLEATVSHRRRVPTGRTHVPLSVVLADGPSGLHGRIEYRSDLVRSADVQALAADLRQVYRALAEGRDVPDLVPTGPAADTDDRPAEAADTARRWPPEWGVHDHVLAWAAEDPDRTAVSDRDTALSYAELDRQSRELAGTLHRHGVRPGDPVALYLHPSVDLVVAMLATLRAGAAYVPLSVRQPVARAAAVRRACGSRTVLTHARMPADAVADVTGDATALTLELLEDPPSSDPLPRFGPDHLAYIVFTSGSTGSPNGVMVSHRNVVGLMRATAARWRLGRDDVWLLFHDPAFDFSVWEIWGSLTTGGRLVIPSDENRTRGGTMLVRLIREHGVTVLNQTPSAFTAWNDADRLAGPGDSALRLVVLGGEAIRRADTDDWLRRHPDTPVVLNMYGITEATVHTTACRLDAATDRGGPGSPIGHRLGGVRTHVLSPDLRPVPPDTPGELYIGGSGVTLGYAGQPGRTAARYLPDPFGPPSSRMYRTGDLVIADRDGALHYLGRADRQVKLSGYRVELAEVEAAVDAHPEVLTSAVVTEDDEGGLRAVCFVVPAASASTGLLRRLRSDLRRWYPTHMVPSAFEQIGRMPTTTNGKVDYRALANRRRGSDRSRPTAEGLVQTVHRIWVDAFGDAGITIDDEFLELGGHSLLATRIVTLCVERLGMRPPVRAVFEHPTVRELSAALPRWREPDA